MNRYLLSSLIALFSISFLSAQICEPDMVYADSAVGVYPNSITESACINSGFYFDLTFVIPETIDFNGVPVTIEQIYLESVTGLPVGLSYSTNPADGIFIPSEGLACANIYGTATADNMPGDYEIVLNGTVTVSLLGELPLATVLDALDAENYVITLEEENSTNCFVTNVQEPLNDRVLIETAPNPFSYNTTITINAKENGNLQLNVYTMLGEIVQSQDIAVHAGENLIPFNGSELSEGIYYFHFSDGHSALTQKMVLQR